MGGQIEKQQDNNGCLSYWLSNTVTLLYLLQRNIKPASGGAYNARLRSPGSRLAPTIPRLRLSSFEESGWLLHTPHALGQLPIVLFVKN